ncbi:hypothetical protein ABPG74_002568 [Tetrahymena malaccensis]
MGYEKPEQLVMTDILNLGFIYLAKQKKVRDICTFFIAKFYLSIIPIVYLQMWFYFGYQLIEKDYKQFGWLRPAVMDFTIISNITVLAYSFCLYQLSVDNSSEELNYALNKFRFLSLLMNPFGYQLCLYNLYTIQVQMSDRFFGICVVLYGVAYQVTIELLKKFLNFSLNWNEYGTLNFIRSTGVLKAFQIEKDLDIPNYIKNALNFSGIIDITVHVCIILFVAEVSFISDQSSDVYQSFKETFLLYQNAAILIIVATYIVIKFIFAFYISRSIWIVHQGDLTIDSVIIHILNNPNIQFVIIFQVAKDKFESQELEEFRLSQDLMQLMDEDELESEKALKEKMLVKYDSQFLNAMNSIRFLSRLVRVQVDKGFFHVHEIISVSKSQFFLNIKKLRISEQMIVQFLSETQIFPSGIKIQISPLSRSQILFERFFRYGLINQSTLTKLDCSKQIQRQMKAINSYFYSILIFKKKILSGDEAQTFYLDTTKVLVDLFENSSSNNLYSNKHSVYTPKQHIIKLL